MSNYEVPQARSETPIDTPGLPVHQHSESTYGLRNFMRVLNRRRKWVIGSIILCLVMAMVVTALMKPTYDSAATIELIKSGGGSMDFGLGDALGQQISGWRPADRFEYGDSDSERRLACFGSDSETESGLETSVCPSTCEVCRAGIVSTMNPPQCGRDCWEFSRLD